MFLTNLHLFSENGGHEEMQDLITEFTLLKDISHPNVIKLLGACTEKGIFFNPSINIMFLNYNHNI